MNEYLGEKGGIYNFCLKSDIIYAVSLLNTDMEENLTYIWESKGSD